MNHARSLVLSGAAVCALLCCAGAALGDRAPVTWLLLDRQLKPAPVSAIVSITDREVKYTGPDGDATTIPREKVLALVPASWARRAPSEPWSDLPGLLSTARRGLGAGLLELTDGSRIIGDLAPSATRAENLAWDHPVFGRFTLTLDSVRRVMMPASPDEPSLASTTTAATDVATTADRLILVNGDVVSGLLAGFVAGTGAELGSVAASVESLPGTGAGAGSARGPARSIDLDRVHTIELVNPPVAGSGVRVWLEEGSVFAGAGVTMTDTQLVTIALPPARHNSGTVKLGLVHVQALALDAGHLAPLSGLTMHTPTAIAPLTSAPAVTVAHNDVKPDALGAADVSLSGPVSVTFDLPTDASRFSGRLVMPEASRLWGDCVVVLSAGGKAVLTHRLNGETPELEFNVPVSGPTLEIRLEQGERGAIQDAAVIQRGLVAIE